MLNTYNFLNMKSNKYKNIKIFLNYTRDDYNDVREFYDELKEHGFIPLMDTENIPGGVKWKRTIERQIKECHIFVACLSEESIEKKGVVQEEIEYAINNKKFTIPLKLKPCTPQKSLRNRQWVDYYKIGGFDKFLETIDAHLDKDRGSDKKIEIKEQENEADLRPPEDVVSYYLRINRTLHHKSIENVFLNDGKRESTICFAMGLLTGGQGYFWDSIENRLKEKGISTFIRKFKVKNRTDRDILNKELYSFLSHHLTPEPKELKDDLLKAEIEGFDGPHTMVFVYTITELTKSTKKTAEELALFWNDTLCNLQNRQIVVIFDLRYEEKRSLFSLKGLIRFFRNGFKSSVKMNDMAGLMGRLSVKCKNIVCEQMKCFDHIEQKYVREFLENEMGFDKSDVDKYISICKIGEKEDPKVLYEKKMKPIIQCKCDGIPYEHA